MTNTGPIQHIIGITQLDEALQLLYAYSLDYPELKETIQKVNNGISCDFHAMRIVNGHYKVYKNGGFVNVENVSIEYGDFFNEINMRMGVAKQALIKVLTQQGVFEGR